MPPMLAKCLVAALITNVLVSLGLFCGVQPSSRLPCGPTVMPFGPQACSMTTPVLVAGLKAPMTAEAPVRVVGSITIIPPSQVMGPGNCPKLQPAGLLAMIGTDT